MRTKKEDISNETIRSFPGKLIETNFVSFGDSYAQELTIKSANKTLKVIYPFVKIHPFKDGEERRWNVLEKSRSKITYQVLNPEPGVKRQLGAMKRLWNDSTSTDITLNFEGGHTLKFNKGKVVPYERKIEKIEYYELIQMEIPFDVWNTKVKK